MRVISDLHIHSKYSRACSKDLVPQNLDKWAKIKGVNLLGTGDFTHPRWFAELRESLEEAEPGFYKLRSSSPSPLPSREGKNLEISSPPVGEDAGEGVDPVRDRPAKGAASAASGQLISNGVDRFTLVRVKLHTGRTHQIRVHFSSIGHPVMGDDLYGKPESQKLKTILSRQFLHASKLEFQLPDGTWLEVQSELPDDLKKVLEILSTKSENRNNI